MSKAVGAILILAGMGIASSLLAIGPEAGRDAPKPAAAHNNPAAVAAVPSAKPEHTRRHASATPQRTPSRPQPPAAASPPPPKPSAPVVVTLPYRAEPLPASAKHKLAGLPRDKVALARELQVELKRVGCYAGEPNGAWTPATRKAMKAFTDRVNASLPVGGPDEILLALVEAHQGEACGSPCPAGQGLADDGRCLPGAILAQAARKAPAPTARQRGGPAAEKPAPAIASWPATVAIMTAPPSGPSAIPGRMALAGPRSDAAPPAIDEPPPGSLTSAARSPGPQAGATQRARQARVRERPQRFEQRAYGRRGGFAESVLFSRHSLF